MLKNVHAEAATVVLQNKARRHRARIEKEREREEAKIIFCLKNRIAS
jgi:hypothetical protein